MSSERGKRKQDLMEQAEMVIDELLNCEEQQRVPSMSEIEEVILELRKRLGEQMAEQVLREQEEKRPVPGPSCPGCGKEM